jgi:DNA-binding transcriptional LysR family regulator
MRSTSELVLDIGETHLICVLPKGHELADRDILDASEVARFSIIAFIRNMPSSGLVDEFFRRERVSYSVACEVSNTSTVCALVEQNIGIALVPAIGFVSQRQRDIVGIPIQPKMTVVVQIHLPKHRRVPRTARRLIAIIRAVALELLTPIPAPR